jgi:hypothetical protein
MSRSPRRRPITAAGRALVLGALLASACSSGEPTQITWFHPVYAFSFIHPPRWTFETAEQDGVRYAFFRSPPTQTTRSGAVSVTLLGQPLGEDQSLEAFAAFYVEGRKLGSSEAVERSGATGRLWRLSSLDGETRSALLLLEEQRHLFGLHIGGEAARFAELEPELETMLSSFTLERPGNYPEVVDPEFRYALRIPPTWTRRSHFARGGRAFAQYASPPVAIDPGSQTVHASLTLSVEPAPEPGTLDAYYEASKARLGDTAVVLAHDAWPDGYVDVLRTETAMTVSRIRRYYRVAEGRGYSLSCESREDVQQRVFRWCDMIASTLRIGAELEDS